MAKKRKRTTAFGSCMRRKLKGRKFRSTTTQHRALGAAARGCATKRRKKRVPHLMALLQRMK